MNWWHRAHATPLTTAVLIVTMLLVPLLGGSALPIPSLLGGMSAGIPVALVLPAIPAAFTLYALNRVPRLYDTTAVRPVARYQAGMLTAAALLATLLGLGAAYAADSSMSLAAARNLLGYLGTGLIVQYLMRPRVRSADRRPRARCLCTHRPRSRRTPLPLDLATARTELPYRRRRLPAPAHRRDRGNDTSCASTSCVATGSCLTAMP